DEHAVHGLHTAGDPEDAAVVITVFRGDAEPASPAVRRGESPPPYEWVVGVGRQGRRGRDRQGDGDGQKTRELEEMFDGGHGFFLVIAAAGSRKISSPSDRAVPARSVFGRKR